MSGYEALLASKHRLTEANLSSFNVLLSVGFGQHRINFVEPPWHDLSVLVAKVSQLARHLGEIVGAEKNVWVWIKTKFEVFSKLV